MAAFAASAPALPLAVAFSGGADSTALLLACAQRWPGQVHAWHIHHGLQAAADDFERHCVRLCQRLGVPLQVRRVDAQAAAGDSPEDAARRARYKAFDALALTQQAQAAIKTVVIAQHADDQAETVVMRLLRGSGVDGMAGMAEWRDAFGVRWLRPMLGVGRDELRDWLTTKGIGWIDDPSNANPEFDRIRIRRTLSELDVDRSALAMVAANLTEVRATLAHYAAEVAHEAVADRGRLTLPRGPFRRAPAEIQRRILIAAARWVTGADYPPRRATVLHALRALDAGSRVTLDGTIISPDGDRLQVTREPAAALRAPRSAGPVWDNRWRVEGLEPGQLIGALGDEALADLSWRLSGLPRDDAAASPAIRDADGNLVAAPLIRAHPGITCLPLRNTEEFRRLIRHG